MKLDMEALLVKNPQVDRNLLRENTEKAVEAAKLGKILSTEKPVARPYGGRRMVSDHEGKERTRFSAGRK